MGRKAYNEALMWNDIGVSTIPLRYKSKIPVAAWNRWRYKIPPQTLLSEWFESTVYNLAILCGGYRNLVVFDFDSHKEYERWYSEADKYWKNVIDNTYRVKTPRGFHAFLFTEEEEVSRKSLEYHIDIQACGKYVATFPSIHPSGKLYEKENNNKIIKVETTLNLFPEYEEEINYCPEITNPSVSNEESVHWLDMDFGELNIIDQIKSSYPILEYAKTLTRMEKTSYGGRWWMGKCPHPLHNDRSPSFRIDTKNGIASCLSTRCALNTVKGFDIIDLYCEINNVNKKIAVQNLANVVGIHY